MFKVGELIRWRCPHDVDYSYGVITEIKNRSAIVTGSGYYTGVQFSVPLRYIEHVILLGGKGCGRK